MACALVLAPRGASREDPDAAASAAPAGRPHIPANAALALISAALAAALFLLVLLLIEGWRLSPIAAAAAVTVMPPVRSPRRPSPRECRRRARGPASGRS